MLRDVSDSEVAFLYDIFNEYEESINKMRKRLEAYAIRTNKTLEDLHSELEQSTPCSDWQTDC